MTRATVSKLTRIAIVYVSEPPSNNDDPKDPVLCDAATNYDKCAVIGQLFGAN